MLIQRLLSMQSSSWEAAKTDTERLQVASNYVFCVGLWRRFGSVDFMTRLGFRPLPASQAEFSVFINEVLEIAASGWREGMHACTDAYSPANKCHDLELAAWMQAGVEKVSARRQARITELRDGVQKGIANRDLQSLCSTLFSKAGAEYIRHAYRDFLTNASKIRELWEKSSNIASVLCESRSKDGVKSRSFRKAVETLWTVKGYATGHGVHAAEVLRDLLPTPLLRGCADLDSWAPVSSNSRRCIARFRGRKPDEDVDSETLQQELHEVYQQRRSMWPSSILKEPSVQLTLPDVQAQLGEFERYLKARAGKPERSAFFPRTG